LIHVGVQRILPRRSIHFPQLHVDLLDHLCMGIGIEVSIDQLMTGRKVILRLAGCVRRDEQGLEQDRAPHGSSLEITSFALSPYVGSLGITDTALSRSPECR